MTEEPGRGAPDTDDRAEPSEAWFNFCRAQWGFGRFEASRFFGLIRDVAETEARVASRREARFAGTALEIVANLSRPTEAEVQAEAIFCVARRGASAPAPEPAVPSHGEPVAQAADPSPVEK